jgi:hypothetical protein
MFCNANILTRFLGVVLFVLAGIWNSVAQSPKSHSLNHNFICSFTVEDLEIHSAILDSNVVAGTRVIFSHGNGYPGFNMILGKSFDSSDWSHVGGLSIAIQNPETNSLTINIRLDDSKSLGKSAAFSGFTTIPPSSSATIVFPMPSTFTGMALPPTELSNSNGKPWNIFGPYPDESDIHSAGLFLSNPKNDRILVIKSITTLPKPKMEGWIDQYGQNARTNWQSKITSDTDFQKQDLNEKEWLMKHSTSSELDRYCGWKYGPQLLKNKFFRTALVHNEKEIKPPGKGKGIPKDAHWWLVTPTGHLFFSLGMDCVNFGEETTLKGRESWFQKIPGAPMSATKVNFFQLNLQRKYGDNWKEAFTDRTMRRLKSWGFNTLGNWCDPVFYDAHQLPYTKCLGYTHPKSISPDCHLPDFFHPDFPKQVAEGLAKGVASCKNDPMCIGYFIDNELCWDTWERSGLADRGTAARAALSAAPGTPAREALIKSLQANYQSLDAFNLAWGTHLSDWNQQVTLSAEQLNPAAHADARKFLYLIAKRYYSVISAELKKVDPNHLYLGSRLNQRPIPVVKAAAKYCDVISFNVYADAIDADAWAFLESMGKPAIIGEFHFTSADRGMFPGRKTCNGQGERADSFTRYVKSVAKHPSFVGCHWFQYIDEPITGRFDTENYPIGFVSVTDEPYHHMISESQRILPEVYKTLSGIK